MIKLGSSVLLVVVTAGLTALAVAGARQPAPAEGPAEASARDVDAWFI